MVYKMKRTILGVLIILVLFASLAIAGGEDSVLGLWNTPEKDSKIEIFKCGDKYCGRIAWLEEPNYPADDDGGMAGRPIVDRRNPNPHFRTRPLLGLQIMEGFTYVGKNIWAKGTIYSPRVGKNYKCQMTLSAPDHLEVRGFIGIPLLGGTSIWTR